MMTPPENEKAGAVRRRLGLSSYTPILRAAARIATSCPRRNSGRAVEVAMLSPDLQPKDAVTLKLLAALAQSVEAVELAQAHDLAEEMAVWMAVQALRQAVKRVGGIDPEPRHRLIRGGRR